MPLPTPLDASRPWTPAIARAGASLSLALLGLAPLGLTDHAAAQPPSASTTNEASDDARISLRVDSSQAEAVLAYLDAHDPERSLDSAWATITASEPYRRLREREESMRRSFEDDDVRAFLDELGPDSADALRSTLDAWLVHDLDSSARRVLAYLPAEAHIRATVYPVIKPQANSFVFDLRGDPAIFLALDPATSAAQFENIVVHELHHIGLASLADASSPQLDTLTPTAREVAEWMGAFGEGLAMLAAAGSPEVHPHASSPPADRARWDRDMAAVEASFVELEHFFLAILDGELEGDAVRDQAMSFFGVQGPWYTVGYHMAVTVETHHGRPVLIACMLDPRLLLSRYNQALAEQPDAARWSPRLLQALGLG
ncbi:MAG: DUF5700 domain-containing putative Zn-dependent protease [Acidobacteriota bacterium]